MKSVSILTPTTIKRKEFLKFVAQTIANQDYKNIIEWLIIDGTKDIVSDLEKTISEIKNINKIPNIIFFKQDLNRNNNIGALRNFLNDNAKGDIMIFFDDDDFYFDKRVSHTVNKLQDSGCDLAVCSAMYMYDTDFQYLYKFKGYGKYHGLACTMGFTRKYIETNRFDDTKEFAEESSFTDGFKNKAVQLDPKNIIIHTSHTINTYQGKKLIIWQNLHIPQEHHARVLNPISNTINSFSKNKKAVKQYMNLITIKKQKSKYDIVYFCGILGQQWHPNNNNLTEHEKNVVHLCSGFANKGYSIAVFMNISDDISINGVDYLNFINFKLTTEYDKLIIWGLAGFISFFKFNNIKFNKLYLDLSNANLEGNEKTLINNIELFNKIIFKSDFHLNLIIDKIKNNYHKDSITNISTQIPNCINKYILKNNNIKREQFRFSFFDFYGNGLPYLLLYFFPVLKKELPEAEFHIYGGMDDIKDENFKKNILPLFNKDGVKEHGKQPDNIIAEEKYRSTFHLYYTSTPSEIDCISIKDSINCGCIPILSKYNVFAERDGLHLDGDPGSQDDNIMAAIQLLEIIKQDNSIEKLQHTLCSTKHPYDSEEVIDKWINIF